jgi:hypothetical protein
MPYEDIEQSERDAEQTYLYLLQVPDRPPYAYTNAPITITATVNSTEYEFKHPKGGIWHGSTGAAANQKERRNDAGPTESHDAGRTGVDIHVSHQNPIIRAHRSFPPPGDTDVTIWRQNEIDGDPYQVWSGVLVECPIEGSTGILRCSHVLELISGSEGLSETYGPTCSYMFAHFPCPVPIPQATDGNLVVEDIDTENFTVTLSGSIRIAGKYKAGVFFATNDDKRFILGDTVVSSDHVLVLTQNFPATTVKIGDVVSVLRGCDRLQQTCRDEWGDFTGNGAAHSGNTLQANKNPHQVGRLQ